MPSEVLADAINDIGLGLLHDDPALVRRVRRLQRAGVANTFTVVALVVVSAVLLTVGLATRSPFAWVAGVLAFLAAFGVDGRSQRRLGRGAVRLTR